jgi:hypothetical protein
MRWLKILIALNGAVSVLYGLMGWFLPTQFWAPAGSPATVINIIQALSSLQLTLGIVQLGSWRMKERWGVELVAAASLFNAFAFGVVLWLASSNPSSDMFHQLGVAGAAAWMVVALVYAFVIYRERQEA